MLRGIAIPLLALLILGGCGGRMKHTAAGAAWPGSRFTPQVAKTIEEAQFPVTPNAVIAKGEWAYRLRDFATHYKRRGHGPLTVYVPRDRVSVFRARPHLREVKRILHESGVDIAAVEVKTLPKTESDRGAIILRFHAFELVTKPCPEADRSITHSASNERSAAFGCALTNSLARMVSDPRDLAGPTGTANGDAGRRVTVIETYRQGKPTGTQRQDAESGAVSTVSRR